ncbi:MAG TPA: ATP-dependent DNA helicase [Rhizomicrobium sp.]|nr:ATP-dependent DNA helicase [Rhizomicrobium sp.]
MAALQYRAPMASLPDLIALVPAPPGAAIARSDGTAERIDLRDARALFEGGDVLVAHAAFAAGRLGTRANVMLFDVLELFAFVRPGLPFVPSALGLARALGLAAPHSPEQSAQSLHAIARTLLNEVAGWPQEVRERLAPLVGTLERAGWRWAPLLKEMVGEIPHGSPIAGLEAWRGLPQWEDQAPVGQPGSQPVEPAEARARLARLVGVMRPEQGSYSEAAAYAFGPREQAGAPRVALVEAGTGTGKTLGYLAPASLWAEKNGPGLWISTYTRNLQRQIVQEIAHLWPDPVERAEKAVVRKGRENYLCLLNFEEAAKRTALTPGQRTVVLALIARWISSPTDGDLSGIGFPAFLAAYLPLSTITDRRGECIYAACPHYRLCFIERAIRRARHASIVIANHALVIAQSSSDWLGEDETSDTPPEKEEGRRLRFVFDEGHHLFDAADSGFSAMLSGREMAELRRWIRGPEGRARTRMRGLEERLKDLIADDEAAQEALQEAVQAAGALAGEGWTQRLGGNPRGPGEVFLAAAYSHVRARSSDADAFYSLEAEPHPMGEELLESVRGLSRGLKRIADPLAVLARLLRKKMNDKTATLEPYTKARLEAAARGVDRRAKAILPAWIEMLETLAQGEIAEEFVDWFEIAREDGRDADVGLRRHWIDPTKPLSSAVLEPAHGALITSATLRDSDGGEDDHWASAEIRTGAGHLPQPARRAHFDSPFRYEDQARIFIIKDVARRDPEALAAAMRELFLASGGGALGLFTAVRALRETGTRIAAPLAAAGINLFAQHIDQLDTGALVDLFRAEENACLLGTDALRDGVDVPGRSLRLVVFDKVPWPKPTILHKARRAKFGKGYDDLITRFRLKQAFGRLIRGPEDRGCFVILEGATPSRLLTAFPEKAPVKRCGLAEAIGDIRAFLGPDAVTRAPEAPITG